MDRRTVRRMTGGAVLALALGLTGCGRDGKKVEPKVETPPGVQKLEPKTPGGPPGSGGQPAGPKGGVE